MGDGGSQIDNVVVEMLGKPDPSVGVQPVRGGQMLNHGLSHELEEEPAGL